MDFAVMILAYYTIVAMMVIIGMSIYQVGETREYSRRGAVINFVMLSFVIIFAVLVLLRG